MRHMLWLWLFWVSPAVFAAGSIQMGCNRLLLVLSPGLTPALVDQEWASANPRAEDPAALELRGCKGQLLDRLALEAPLAKLDPVPLRGTSAPTYLISVDLTAEAGSYNGPLTFPVQVVGHRLRPAFARYANGLTEPVRLALTGKAAWKKVPVRGSDDILSVSCLPDERGFITSYRRYQPSRRGWKVAARSEKGLWESDGGFPEVHSFPPRR